jgi:phosphoglucomutase
MLVNVPELITAYYTDVPDPIVPALLAAEITARMGRDPGEIYHELTREFGEPAYDRVEAPATPIKRNCWRNSHPGKLISPSWLAKESRISSHTRRETARL